MTDSLWPHEWRHIRLPCSSPSPRAYSCPLSQWCQPTISSSVAPFSSCPKSFPASGSSNESALGIRWPQYWSFSFSIIYSNEYLGLISFRIDWLDLHAVEGTRKSFSSTIVWKHQLFSVLYGPALTSIHDHWKAVTRRTFVGKVMSLLFNILSRLVITSLPRSKCLLFLWLQSPSTLILEPKKINELPFLLSPHMSLFPLFPHLFAMKCKSVSFPFLPICLPWSDEARCHGLCFWNVEF